MWVVSAPGRGQNSEVGKKTVKIEQFEPENQNRKKRNIKVDRAGTQAGHLGKSRGLNINYIAKHPGETY